MTVLIVGAGPTGLALACDLARRRVPFRIVDRTTSVSTRPSGGIGLRACTLEAFSELGVFDTVLAAGAPFPRFRLYRGPELLWERSVAEMPPMSQPSGATVASAVPTWMISRQRIKEILHARLIELDGRVEWNTAILGVTQYSGGVIAHSPDGDLRADYLVGADGQNSTIRTVLGIEFEHDTREPARILTGHVRVDGLEGNFCHILAANDDARERFSLWSLPDSDYHQFAVTVPADQMPELTLDSMQQLCDQRSGRTDVRLHDLRQISLHRTDARTADRYQVGRVLLAGDAVHLHSPAHGYGLDTGIDDAYKLGRKLAALHCGSGSQLLET